MILGSQTESTGERPRPAGWWGGLAAAALLVAVLLPGLGSSGLLDPWEMDRAAVARRIAAHPKVVVIDRDGALLSRLDEALGRAYAFERLGGRGAKSARLALERAPTDLAQDVVHAAVIDIEAVIDGRRGQAVEPVVAQLDRLAAENRGMVLIAVAPEEAREALRETLAEARARAHARRLGGGWWRQALPAPKELARLAPLFLDDHVWSTAEGAADAVRRRCPSPWLRAQHKVDGRVAPAPWLDTVLVAASLSLLGPSEIAARLPGALIALLTGLLLFLCARRLWDDTTAWLSLLVFASLPMTVGAARVVTLEDSGALGVGLVVFGLALGVRGRGRLWGLWYGAGLLVLLLGQGLAGLTVGALIGAAYALVSAERRVGTWVAGAAGLLALGLAAWAVLADDAGPMLRSWRFTRVPFRGGLPAGRTDFSWMIGQLGFALYPWGPLLVLGAGRLVVRDGLRGGAEGPPGDGLRADDRVRLLLALGFGVPLLGWMAMLHHFHHPVLPLAPVAALITGLLLRDVLRGRVSGGVVALLVVLPTLLLHREIGKQASVLVRWLAFDPPFGGQRAANIWPHELGLDRALRAVVLLAVLAFGVGLGRPVTAARGWLRRLREPGPAAWALGAVAIVWALDAVISLGTRVDVLLRAEAARTGYLYDRVWTTIQGTRPEVVAGATLFALLLLAAVLVAAGRGKGWAARPAVRLAMGAARPFGRVSVALAAAGAASVGVLLSGLMVFVDVRGAGWAEAAVAGLGSAPFAIPAALGAVAATLAAVTRRAGGSGGTRGEGLWAGLLGAVVSTPALSAGVPALVAVAGVGVGASEAAGTWSYGFLAGCWSLAVAVGLVVAGRAGADLRVYAAGLAGTALTVWGGIFAVLAARFVADGHEPWRYLRGDLLTSPDAAVLLAALAVLWLNRVSVGRPLFEAARDGALLLASLIERPRWGVGLLVLSGLLLTGGYAHTLLPGLSLHFSQKHILDRVAEVGGNDLDGHGLPRTFRYAAGGRHAIGSNFYTQDMPAIGDRRVLLGLLSGRNVATRVTDWGAEGRSVNMALPGWSSDNDADGDGERDGPAWFGIAAGVDGVRVKAAAPLDTEALAWSPDQWKGATLHGPGGEVEVVANDADTLTLARPTSLVADDPARGAFALETLRRDGARADASAMRPERRFAVLPRTAFSELNHAFRLANGGRHIALLDARSSRLVLAATDLPGGHGDENWIAEAVLDDDALDAMADLRRVSVDFDGKLELIAWRLERESVSRSQKYELELFFRVHEPVKRSYKLFMHPHPLHRDLWPLDWHTGGDKDAKRCSGCFQTDHWVQGDIVRFPVVQEVPLGTSSGAQDIILGLYDPLTDKRLPIKSASGAGVVKHGDNRVTIARLQVR